MYTCSRLAALIVVLVVAVVAAAVDAEGTPAAGRPSRRWSLTGARSSQLDDDEDVLLRAKVIDDLAH